MFNKILLYLLCSIMLVVWSIQISNATTNCTQSFTFILATSAQKPVFWVIEDVGGECWYSNLIQIVCGNEKDTAIYTNIGYPDEWNWKRLRERIKDETCQPAIELKNHDGLWSVPGLSWYIEAPPLDSSLLELFQKEYNEGRERDWNSTYGMKGVNIPSTNGINIKLAYFYPGGLYIGYTIPKAYFFPQSGYILVFINQPRMAIGGDTMHGFLFLKIT